MAFSWFFSAKGENEKIVRQIRSSSGLAVFVGDASDKAHWVNVGRLTASSFDDTSQAQRLDAAFVHAIHL